MHIKFLGTGPAGRIPRQGCHNPVCKEARKPKSKSRRLQTSTLFSFGGMSLLIDATQDFNVQRNLIKKPPEFLLITHGHSDAIGGLRQLNSYFKAQSQFITVFLEKATYKKINNVQKLRHLNFKFIKPGQNLSFGLVQVLPIRVEHSFRKDIPALGFLFKAGRKKLIYISDFKKISFQTRALMKNVDLAILDCAAFQKPIPNHQSLPQILKLNQALGLKKVFLTQIGIGWPFYEKAQAIVSKQAKNIFLAYDGLELNF